VPPLSTVVLMAAPAEWTYSVPPELTVVKFALPSNNTT
jgi:hypothetical protein